MIPKNLFFTFLFSCFIISYNSAYSKISPPSINLKEYDFSKNGPITLEGKWSFYWNQFLAPTDLKNNQLLKKGIKVQVPGSWTEKRSGNYPKFGYGTYLFKINGVKKNTEMALTIKDIPTAFRIFIVQNNQIQKIGGKGKVGRTKETSIPQYGTFTGDFRVNDDSFFILIHLSNFHHRLAGLINLPKLGPKQDIHDNIKTENSQFFFVLGLFLLMGVNHFSIFFQRREDKGSLWFSLFCFTLMLRSLALESHFDLFFVKPNSYAFNLNYKVRYLTFFLLSPIFFNFIKSLFENYIKNKFLKGYWYLCLTASVIVLLSPVYIFTHLTGFFQIIILLSGIYLIVQIARSTLYKVPYARICLTGIFLLVIGVIWDILVSRKLAPPPLITPFTTTFFIFIQSYIISRKFSLAYKLAEKLNIELEEKVIKRTKEISALLNHLESSIFSVKKDLKVIPPFSQYSERLFKKNIEGENIFNFLFKPIEKGSRKYNEMTNYFESIFGDDELNYSFIEANFLQNIILSDNDKPEGRSLKISYSPLYDHDGLVERLMFIVEDITEFEKFYQEAKRDQLSYKFIKEVLTIENKKELVSALNQSIRSGIESLDSLLSTSQEITEHDYFLKSYKNTVEQIINNVEIMPLLTEKIYIKTADFDYVSLLGEEKYGNKNIEKNFNYQLEVTDKINDIVQYLLIYGNVVKLFYPVKFDFLFDHMIEVKILNLKSILADLFQKTFHIHDMEEINKDILASIVQLAKAHPGFDEIMHLIQQRTKFISLLLTADEKNEASKTFSTMANLFHQMPPQEKLSESDLNQNLILPFKEMQKISL